MQSYLYFPLKQFCFLVDECIFHINSHTKMPNTTVPGMCHVQIFL